jgi:hypothetical protein
VRLESPGGEHTGRPEVAVTEGTTAAASVVRVVDGDTVVN